MGGRIRPPPFFHENVYFVISHHLYHGKINDAYSQLLHFVRFSEQLEWMGYDLLTECKILSTIIELRMRVHLPHFLELMGMMLHRL